MSSIIFQRGKENLSSYGGLAILGQALEGMPSFKNINQHICLGSPDRGAIQADQVILAVSSLHSLGFRSFANFDFLCKDPGFREVFNNNTFSSVTLRQKTDSMAELGATESYIDKVIIDSLKGANFIKVNTIKGKKIPLDIDVTPFCNDNCKKEGVGYTYKEFDGYAPIMAYFGGYALCFSLRPGSQHSENGAVEFLERCLNIIKGLGISNKKILVRVDSGHDAADFIKKCLERKVYFIIKRNLRRLNKEEIFEDIKNSKTSTKHFSDYCDEYNDIDYNTKNKKLLNDENKSIVNIINIRIKKIKNNIPLLYPEIEVQCWWTNLKISAERIIQLYCDHATSEQYHSEIKSEINIERLPSSKFKTNSLFLQIAAISFNILKKMGDLYINFEKQSFRNVIEKRFRIKTIIHNLCYRACKVIHHTGRVFFSFGVGDPFFNSMSYIYKMI